MWFTFDPRTSCGHSVFFSLCNLCFCAATEIRFWYRRLNQPTSRCLKRFTLSNGLKYVGRITADHLDLMMQVACFKAHNVERLGSVRVAVYTSQRTVNCYTLPRIVWAERLKYVMRVKVRFANSIKASSTFVTDVFFLSYANYALVFSAYYYLYVKK
jgi:hypothetical protein